MNKEVGIVNPIDQRWSDVATRLSELKIKKLPAQAWEVTKTLVRSRLRDAQKHGNTRMGESELLDNIQTYLESGDFERLSEDEQEGWKHGKLTEFLLSKAASKGAQIREDAAREALVADDEGRGHVTRAETRKNIKLPNFDKLKDAIRGLRVGKIEFAQVKSAASLALGILGLAFAAYKAGVFDSPAVEASIAAKKMRDDLSNPRAALVMDTEQSTVQMANVVELKPLVASEVSAAELAVSASNLEYLRFPDGKLIGKLDVRFPYDPATGKWDVAKQKQDLKDFSSDYGVAMIYPTDRKDVVLFYCHKTKEDQSCKILSELGVNDIGDTIIDDSGQRMVVQDVKIVSTDYFTGARKFDNSDTDQAGLQSYRTQKEKSSDGSELNRLDVYVPEGSPALLAATCTGVWDAGRYSNQIIVSLVPEGMYVERSLDPVGNALAKAAGEMKSYADKNDVEKTLVKPGEFLKNSPWYKSVEARFPEADRKYWEREFAAVFNTMDSTGNLYGNSDERQAYQCIPAASLGRLVEMLESGLPYEESSKKYPNILGQAGIFSPIELIPSEFRGGIDREQRVPDALAPGLDMRVGRVVEGSVSSGSMLLPHTGVYSQFGHVVFVHQELDGRWLAFGANGSLNGKPDMFYADSLAELADILGMRSDAIAALVAR